MSTPSSTSSSEPRGSRPERRYAILFLASWLCLFLLPAACVWVVDPYQLYRPSTFMPERFYTENVRYQLPGVIRHYLGERTGTDSIVIGTSLSNNFRDEDIRALLGWRALNLSLRSATLGERSVVLQQALSTGRVKHVLFEVNPADIIDDGPDPWHNPAFPAALYTPDWYDKGPYLFNRTVLAEAAAICLQSPRCLPGSVPAWLVPPLDPAAWTQHGLHNWRSWMQGEELAEQFRRFNAPENRAQLQQQLQSARQRHAQQNRPWQEEMEFVAAQRDLVEVVKARPDVEFRIWVAPVSLLRLALEDDAAGLNRILVFRRFLVQELAHLPHVRLYGLDAETAITGKPEHYMDVAHYNLDVQRWILESVAHDRHRLQRDNVDAYILHLRQQLAALDISPGASQRQNTK